MTERKKDKFVTKKINLFPGYFFVKFDETYHWRKVNSTYGVNKIVCFGNFPSAAPDLFIKKMQDECNYNFVNNENRLNIGDNVKIKKGPFSNLIGQIFKVRKNERIWILLDLITTTKNISSKANNLIIVT